jgi:DNA-binding NarL/FixJ family response regulator
MRGDDVVGPLPGSGVRRFERPAPAGTLRVVIADDHVYYRHGLADLLSSFGIDVVGEASNGLAAIETVEETAPDVVVMNVNMRGLSGVEATRRLTEQASGSRVLVLSMSLEESDVTDAIQAGASGYLLKDEPVDEIVAGIRATALGHSPLSAGVAAVLLRRIRDAIGAGDDLAGAGLSGRDLEVLDQRARGRADHEIAAALGIDTTAVHAHTSSILIKLRVESGIRFAVGGGRGRQSETRG